MAGLIVALDTGDLKQAKSWAAAVAPHCGMLKLGLEFFTAHGWIGVRAIQSSSFVQLDPVPIFLDLKLHDVPTTVARAVHELLSLRPAMLTVHGSGGRLMVAAARKVAEGAGAGRPKIIAVTSLTSDHARNLHIYHVGRDALAAGADGLVCGPKAVPYLRDRLGPDVLLVVPGIRREGDPIDDHVHTMTPREAAEAGADWIVVGRSITTAVNPGAAARTIAAEIA